MSSNNDSVAKEPVSSTAEGSRKGPSAAPQDEKEFPSSKKLALIMLALLLALFLVALDRTVIATAIPQISNQFNSLDDIGWYASSYLITCCSTQLIFGRLYTFYPVKTMYLISIGIFEVGSAVCGAAPNSKAFIVGRAIAGIGAAGVQNGGLLLMVASIPLGKRPKYMGALGTVSGLSSIIGPLLGGAFTNSKATWRWCFYINLPLGAITVIIVLLVLHSPKLDSVPLKTQLAKLDPLGTLCFLPGMICLLLAIQWGGITYAWSSARIIVLFVLFVIVLAAFIAIQIWKQDNATVQQSIIANRSVTLAILFAFLTGGTMIIIIYYLPLWFQAILNVDAMSSGIKTLPLVLSLVFGANLSGALISRFGWYNPFMIMCVVLVTVGAGMLTTLKVDSGTGAWVGISLLSGFGFGMGMQQAMLVVQAALPKKDVSIGISLVILGQTLGSAIMISVAQSVFTNSLLKGLGNIKGVDPLLVLNTGATNLRKVIPKEVLTQVLQVYNHAVTRAFLVATVVAGISIIPTLGVPWINVKGLKEGGRVGAGRRKMENVVEKERKEEVVGV